MLYGVSPVHACLIAARRTIDELLVRPRGGPRLQEIVELARANSIAVREVDVHELGNLAKTRHHQGVVLRCGELPTVELDDLRRDTPCLYVALDLVEDPQNLGGIVRSATYFGAAGLILTRARSAPLSAAASKASAGALETLPVARVGNLAQSLRTLKKEGFEIAGADLEVGAIAATDWLPSAQTVLLLGSEGDGLRELSRKLCDQRLRLAGEGVESLNVGVAAGILLHQWRMQVSS